MRILLALDGSPSSIVARDLVAGLAWPAETSVDVLSAFHTLLAGQRRPQRSGSRRRIGACRAPHRRKETTR